ncbi:unnamed protein product [Sphacelaria rigidula]
MTPVLEDLRKRPRAAERVRVPRIILTRAYPTCASCCSVGFSVCTFAGRPSGSAGNLETFDVSPSSIISLFVHSVIFTILHNFTLIPGCHNFSHNQFLLTLS